MPSHGSLWLLAWIAACAEANPCPTTQTNTQAWQLLDKSTAGFQPRDGHASATFLGKHWVVGGQTEPYTTRQLIQTTRRSDVWSSVDGNNWVSIIDEAPFQRRYGHTLTVFNEKTTGPVMVLMGGFSPIPANDIWYTKDGVSWTQVSYTVPWTSRGWHCAFAHNNKLWVAGGSPLNNEVWATDSVVRGNWIQQPQAPWPVRAGHSCVNHKIKNSTLGDNSTESTVVVLAGWGQASQMYNDVWSLDSTNKWNLLTEAAPWPIRAWTAALSFNALSQVDAFLGPRLWIFGGGRIGNGVNSMFTYSDVWVTRDGVKWQGTSSDRLGQSTAQWCQVTEGDGQVCIGKWGHTVLLGTRNVADDHVNVCGVDCRTSDDVTYLGGTIIAQCNSSHAPPGGSLSTTRVGSVYQVSTTFSDGCGQCNTARYYDTPTVPAVLLIAGSSGDQKVSDVFVSTDFFLCELDGKVCSNQGYCARGGVCLCDPELAGDYCDQTAPPSTAAATSCLALLVTVTLMSNL
ncbi:hypothetical protein AeMF1_016943 [Aphanomyces euteiches]|nr:hypothetical protein AeMF1_016943 [Aphanomyces euteiches]